jgi:hypothetical protein
MEILGAQELAYFRVITTMILAFANELPPKVALEKARRSVGSEMRPTREEMEELFKQVDAG